MLLPFIRTSFLLCGPEMPAGMMCYVKEGITCKIQMMLQWEYKIRTLNFKGDSSPFRKLCEITAISSWGKKCINPLTNIWVSYGTRILNIIKNDSKLTVINNHT